MKRILQVLAMLLAFGGTAWADASQEAAGTANTAIEAPGRRVALVIGNGAYNSSLMPQLANPQHDAEAIASTLEKLGFEVDVVTDATKQTMEDAVARLARKARDADVTLIFYAGHGLQYQAKNYLAPVDATLSDDTDLRRRFVRLDDVLGDLADAKGALIVLLDACRDSGVIDALRAAVPKTRSAWVSRGLARIPDAEGQLVAFATQSNRVAADGDGADSPFTTALIAHLGDPGIELRTALTRVRMDVAKATNNEQLPEVSDSLLGEIYLQPLKPPSAGAFGAPPASTEHPANPPAVPPVTEPKAPTAEQVTDGDAAPSAAVPSFNCAAASAPAEVAICNDATLADLDNQLASRFSAKLMATPAASARGFRMEQLRWLQGRNACGADKECLASSYQARLQQLAQAGAARQQAAITAAPQHPEADFATPADISNAIHGIQGAADRVRRDFCQTGYCAIEWTSRAAAPRIDYGYRIHHPHGKDFFSTCQQFGQGGQRFCWASTGKAWVDQPTGNPNDWVTVRWVRQGFPAAEDAGEPGGEQPVTPPVSRRAARQAAQAQFGAAIASAVIGQILNHIH